MRYFSILTFLLLTFLFTSIVTAQKAGELKLEPYTFESSRKDKVDAEMGTLLVPENRDKKDSRLIKLKFVRFKSTSENPGSPIIYLAGGPGGSGIRSATFSRFPLFMAMREAGDVIAFDQRGTGISEPSMGCKERLTYPVGKAPDLNELRRIYNEQARLCYESFKAKGVDLAGYNTNSSADDLEDLRKALGAKKISLWGISYGTHLALATAKRHKKSIDKMILAGVEGPDHTLKLPGNVQRHLEVLDQRVKNDPELNKMIPSLTSLMTEVLEKLDKEPVVVDVVNPRTKKNVKVTINRFAVQFMTWMAFGSGDASIPMVYYRLSKGDYKLAGQRWLSIVTSNRPVGSAMTFMMDCHSGATSKRRTQIAREAEETLLGGVMNFPFPEVCGAWGNPDAGKSFRKNFNSKIPTLFISGTLDVRTPPSNAEEVRAGFKKSSHLIIDGAVHSDPLFLSTPKIGEVMRDFMAGKKLPDMIDVEMSKPFTFVKPR